MRRVLVLALASVAVGGAGAVALLPKGPAAAQTTQGSDPTPSASSSATSARTTRAVERRTLRLTDALDGTLGYDGSQAIAAGAGGTLTRLPAVGRVLKRGAWSYELDGKRRGIVLYGQRPMWRTLEDGMTSGSDVRQLEQNLANLGLLSRKRVDATWDDWTTAAVKKFEKRYHLSVDGVLAAGDIVFVPEPMRVAELQAKVGDRVGPGTPILSGTSARRAVTVELEVSKLDLLPVGQAVSLELPDGTTIDGTVGSIGRTVDTGDDSQFPTGESSDPTVTVTIDLADAAAAARYDAAPVTVDVVRESRENVLAVPVQALVALLEGGYAVEVADAAGATRLVAVETGLFENGWVEVRGEGLAEGQAVVVPS